MNAILTLLYQRTGYDFRDYRPNTLKRRIARWAREGTYPKEQLRFVSPPIWKAYFQPVKNGYQIIQKMGDCVNFRDVDLVNGLVSGEFDLISCRNVLIYFSKELQERVILRFRKVLKPGGLLWLGKAESLWGRGQKLFECFDKNAKFFRVSTTAKSRESYFLPC